MNTAQHQQRQDAAKLLEIAVEEHNQYVKAYNRLRDNVATFVDRSNHELATLAMAIAQKQQNIETLRQMAEGKEVTPGPPVIAKGQVPAPQPPQAPPAPQPNGVAHKEGGAS
jgi:hypothetical protein